MKNTLKNKIKSIINLFLFGAIFSLLITTFSSCNSSDNIVSTSTSEIYYSVIFKNYDGEVLYVDKVTHGNSASYLGETPIKIDAWNVKSYTFIGWDKSFDCVEENIEVFAQFEESFISSSSNNSIWNEKTMSVMGDSISNGFVSGKDQIEVEKRYYGIAASKHNMIIGNCSTINGTTISSTGNSSDTFISRVDMLDENADLIIIAGGTNDYALGTPLGSLNDKQDTSFYGALYVLCQKLSSKFFDKKVVFITPVNRRNANGFNATYETYSSKTSGTLQDYRDAITIIAGNEFGFTVIDGAQLGLNALNSDTFSYQFGDTVHLNENGHKIMGESLANKLYTI